MKKFIFMMISAMFALSFSSCNKCKSDKADEKDTTAVDVDTAALNVENVTGTDKQYMFTNYGADYRYFECQITMKDFLDEETDGTVESIINVFQVVYEKEKSADVYVVFATHANDSTAYNVQRGFWVEDQLLNDEVIKVSFKEAFDKLMATNLPKPHSRQCVLRKEVAPVDANPQYIFGNSHATVYVDAVTGDISDKNPAFPEEKGFKMPLGEWP